MKNVTIEKDEFVEMKEDTTILVKKGVSTIILSRAKVNNITTEKNAKATLITLSSSDNHANLIGDNSEIITINLYNANNDKIEINSVSEHTGKNTKSYINCKGVLTNSESNVKGMIKINENAEDSDGYQKSDALILKDSKVISVPDLEIHNNNVKCSHGSTITRLDEDKIFYMQSRGLEKEEAEKELINGFYEEVIEDLPENLKRRIRDEIL